MNNCPSCEGNLVGGLIYDTMLEQNGGDEEKAVSDASMYGATKTEGRWGLAIALYDQAEDRTIGWQCPHCGHQWGRWHG